MKTHRIDEIHVGASAMPKFNAMSNKSYTVQFTPTLNSNGWTKLVDVITRATNRVETIFDPAPATNRFYRLVTPRHF